MDKWVSARQGGGGGLKPSRSVQTSFVQKYRQDSNAGASPQLRQRAKRSRSSSNRTRLWRFSDRPQLKPQLSILGTHHKSALDIFLDQWIREQKDAASTPASDGPETLSDDYDFYNFCSDDDDAVDIDDPDLASDDSGEPQSRAMEGVEQGQVENDKEEEDEERGGREVGGSFIEESYLEAALMPVKGSTSQQEEEEHMKRREEQAEREIQRMLFDPIMGFVPTLSEIKSLDILSDLQRRAVSHIVHQSRIKSKTQWPSLISRAKTLGFSETDVKKTLRFIRDDAPIIIHFDPKLTLHKLLDDSHYRNQFETHTTGGSNNLQHRTQWEARLFNGIYGPDCLPFERVKYGVLNVVNDPSGISRCFRYGTSHLVLSKDVRMRTTFSECDSSNDNTHVASCEHYAHVLNGFTDYELVPVLKVGTGSRKHYDSDSISYYKEVQIHGPISLHHHISCLVLNSDLLSDPDLVSVAHQFSSKFNVPIRWTPRPIWPSSSSSSSSLS